MIIAVILISILCGMVVLLSATLLAQIVMSLGSVRRRPGVTGTYSKAILVPAHDESRLIVATVAHLLEEVGPEDRLIVVADNCSDGTAVLARAAGAEVVIRHDPERRGKGFALDFGLNYLRSSGSPEVVVVVDADCRLTAGSLQRLAQACMESGRPAQAPYAMAARIGDCAGSRLASFAHEIKGVARPLGWSRLGAPCHLMGSGMAFPWALADRAHMATASIVEDLELGIRLALTGAPPLHCPDTGVTSVLPSNDRARSVQKTRWEHGHLGAMLRHVPALVRTALRRADPALLAMALDLSVPPLGMLVALTLGCVCLASLMVAAGTYLPLALAGSAAAMQTLAFGLAWWRWGRDILRIGDIVSIPGLVIGKVPAVLSFLTRRQAAWIRSERG